MPKGSYKTLAASKKNALNDLMKKTKCDGVKIESNNGKNFKIIKLVQQLKIPVMGHIGYTPQFKKKFKVQGLNNYNQKKLIEEVQTY